MIGAPDPRLGRFAFDLSSQGWEKALRSGCIAAFAAFWFVFVVWPSAFGTEGGTWWTRLVSTFDGAWALIAVIGAPSLIVLGFACLFRRVAFLACTLAAALGVDVFGLPLIVAPAVRIRREHEGMVGVAIVAGAVFAYIALALLLIVLGAIVAGEALQRHTRRTGGPGAPGAPGAPG